MPFKVIGGILTVFSLIILYPCTGITQPDKNVSTEINTSDEAIAPDDIASADSIDRKLLVYFFHGRKRCMSCRTIEAYAYDAIRTYYGELLESGRIEWLKRNYANPKFAHFKDEFELYTQSVVLVDMQGDKVLRWKNLKDVWTFSWDKDAYYEYIRREVEAYLKEG